MYKRRANFQPQLGKPRTSKQILHQEDAGELYVRRVSLIALLNQWKQYHIKTHVPRAESYFIECNMNGNVNWQTAKVFTSSELVGRNNTKVVSFEQ